MTDKHRGEGILLALSGIQSGKDAELQLMAKSNQYKDEIRMPR